MLNRQQNSLEEPVYRSGAVAKLTGIPVQTLRVWERRYNIVGPRQSVTGQRLYSPADVERLTVIKLLVGSDHAIGSIASLDLDHLQAMLDKVSRATSAPAQQVVHATNDAKLPVRVAIVGEALNLRVEHHHLAALQVVAKSLNVALAGETLSGVTADALLIELPTLQRETPKVVRALAQQVGARRIVIEYGFGSQRIMQELRALGCSLLRAPMEIEKLASLCGALPAGLQTENPAALLPIVPAAMRRFDNKALAQILTTSVKLNCDCPHHLCELLLHLCNFETYSAECESNSPADTALHHYLREVAGTARAMLEVALVRAAEAEGLPMPE